MGNNAETISRSELLRLRMLAQGLEPAASAPGHTELGVATGAERIASTARSMLAVQGQDWRASRWALGVRTPGTTVDDVHAAFNTGTIVRSWPMRGTIHVTAAEDIGWMQTATNRRVLAGAPKRREFLGITDQTLDRLVEVSITALRDGQPLNRDELASAWTDAGIEWQSNWRYHLIWWLCQNGLAVFGPTKNGDEPLLVLADEWITSPRNLSGEAALAELAERYAVARGAVTAKDLAWWSGLTSAEVKTGLSAAEQEGRLVQLRLADDGDDGDGDGDNGKGTPDGVGTPSSGSTTTGRNATEFWASPECLARLTESGESPERRKTSEHGSRDERWLLLPAFDEHLLGYQDRAPQLDPEHFERVLPGRNGMFLATIVRDGKVVGTWKRGTRKAEGLLGTAFPGYDLEPGVPRLSELSREWASFHGFPETPFALAQA